MKTTGFDPHIFDKVFKQGKFSSGIVITFQVMAIAGMSPGDPDPIRSLPQRGQNKLWAHAACTGNTDDPYVGRIFHPADTRQVRSTVTAPVA